MNIKKIIILLFICITFIGCTPTYELEYTNPGDKIPKTLELSNKTDFFQTEHNYPNWTCKSDTTPKIVPLYIQNIEGCTDIGCATIHSRSAYICNDQYLIEDYNDSVGPSYFGPFDLKK